MTKAKHVNLREHYFWTTFPILQPETRKKLQLEHVKTHLHQGKHISSRIETISSRIDPSRNPQNLLLIFLTDCVDHLRSDHDMYLADKK